MQLGANDLLLITTKGAAWRSVWISLWRGFRRAPGSSQRPAPRRRSGCRGLNPGRGGPVYGYRHSGQWTNALARFPVEKQSRLARPQLASEACWRATAFAWASASSSAASDAAVSRTVGGKGEAHFNAVETRGPAKAPARPVRRAQEVAERRTVTRRGLLAWLGIAAWQKARVGLR